MLVGWVLQRKLSYEGGDCLVEIWDLQKDSVRTAWYGSERGTTHARG